MALVHPVNNSVLYGSLHQLPYAATAISNRKDATLVTGEDGDIPLSTVDAFKETWEVEGKDAGYKNSLGIEAIAIFTAITYLIRVLADVAQRIRNGRSFTIDPIIIISDMIENAAKLYGETSVASERMDAT
ncbi:hypothetical protein Hamer_G007745 [Homarus americanus]|uniref:Uncharacterized protein n=1 Tax=Homarus americanus TaxID=6706 RepID=A0A8J5JX22_HOMAM|nr:hypothetical protein Hamer_G007745 [Homarus americanus]